MEWELKFKFKSDSLAEHMDCCYTRKGVLLNYFFNNDTAEQLVHLIGNQRLIVDWEKLKTSTGLEVVVERGDEPNSGAYRILFENIIESVFSSENSFSGVISEFAFQEAEKRFVLDGEGFHLELIQDPVRVSAYALGP